MDDNVNGRIRTVVLEASCRIPKRLREICSTFSIQLFQDIKAFYMRQNDDGRTVAAMDMLVPKVIYKISLVYNHYQ